MDRKRARAAPKKPLAVKLDEVDAGVVKAMKEADDAMRKAPKRFKPGEGVEDVVDDGALKG